MSLFNTKTLVNAAKVAGIVGGALYLVDETVSKPLSGKTVIQNAAKITKSGYEKAKEIFSTKQ